jgi:uncharacterized membrane protein
MTHEADRRTDGGTSMSFTEVMDGIVKGFEVVGVGILCVGSFVALGRYVLALGRGHGRESYERTRRDVGRSILLGLEVLIIADIVRTVTIDLTLESLATLGLLVLVRTFLSFSLEIELDGKLPWRREVDPEA